MNARRKDVLALIGFSLLAFLPFIRRPLFVDDHAHFQEAQAWGENRQQAYPSQAGELGWTPGSEPGEANPPVYFYLMSAWTRVAGPATWKAHLFLMPLQILGVLAFYGLACRFVRQAFWASLLWLVTPHFWLTANTLLLDSLLAPLLLVGLFLWIEGWEKRKTVYLLLAVFVLAALALVKYTGVIGVALAAAWVLLEAQDKRSARWLFLLIPVACFLGWSHWTALQYGTSHFEAIARSHMVWPTFGKLLTLMIFSSGTTGCLIFGLLLWLGGRSQKGIVVGIVIAALAAGLALGYPLAIGLQMGCELGLFLTWCWFIFGQPRVRAPGESFLWAWIFLGYAELSVAIGWVCARYLVILGPVLVLVTVQRIESWSPGILESKKFKTLTIGGLALVAGVLAVCDYRQAEVDLAMSRQVQQLVDAGQVPDKLYYPAAALGGLGYYLNKEKTVAVPPGDPLPPGALVLLPWRTLSPRFFPKLTNPQLVNRYAFGTMLPFRTLDLGSGAGFYGSIWGPLPFSISSEPIEVYALVRNGSGSGR